MNAYNYVITLKAPSFFLVNNISKWMLLFAVVFFIYHAVVLGSPGSVFYVSLLVVLLLWFIYLLFLRKKESPVYYRTGLLIASAGWLYPLNIYAVIGILFIMAAFFEKPVKSPPQLAVNKDGVFLNLFLKKQYPWSAISNLVLKDDLLTIDYKNNKIFQKEIVSDATVDFEKKFNEFCKENIS